MMNGLKDLQQFEPENKALTQSHKRLHSGDDHWVKFQRQNRGNQFAQQGHEFWPSNQQQQQGARGYSHQKMASLDKARAAPGKDEMRVGSAQFEGEELHTFQQEDGCFFNSEAQLDQA